jgi:hypothetical protein
MRETISREPSEDENPLPLDAVYDALGNERRRTTIEYLLNEDPPISIEPLAKAVASRENDIPVDELDSMDRKKAYVGLYQCHLPRMDDAGIITFDKKSGMINRGVHFEQIKSVLNPEIEKSDRKNSFAWVSIVAATVGLTAMLAGGTASLTQLQTSMLAGSYIVVIIDSAMQLDLTDVL